MIFIGWIFIILGIFFIISGIIALFRFPDFFTRLHGASLVDCFGIPLCFVGLAFLQSEWVNSMKLILVIIVILIVNPVSTHALARAAMEKKIDNNGRIK